MYEARCRRCFEPQLAHEKVQEKVETKRESKQDEQKEKSRDASDTSRARAATH
jgi:hypothetical protein